jgi:hypothetical protein
MTEQMRFEILQAFKACNLKTLIAEVTRSIRTRDYTFVVYDLMSYEIKVLREDLNDLSAGVKYLLYFSEEDTGIIPNRIHDYILQLKLTS